MSFLRELAIKIVIMILIIFGSFGCEDVCPPEDSVVRCPDGMVVKYDECGNSYCDYPE